VESSSEDEDDLYTKKLTTAYNSKPPKKPASEDSSGESDSDMDRKPKAKLSSWKKPTKQQDPEESSSDSHLDEKAGAYSSGKDSSAEDGPSTPKRPKFSSNRQPKVGRQSSGTTSNPSQSQEIIYPPFFHQLTEDDWNNPERVKEISEDNWLPDELVREVETYYPTHNDKDHIGIRNLDVLMEKTMCLFSVGRTWASYKQLGQALELFAGPWGFVVSSTMGKFICHYGVKANQTIINDDERRRKSSSLKGIVKCPFEIRYSLIEYGRQARTTKVNRLRFAVKITGAEYRHTCSPSVDSQRVGMIRSGKLAPNYDQLKSVIDIVRNNPAVDNTTLRKMLADHVPHFRCLDHKYLYNVRNFCLRFILDKDCPITTEDCDNFSNIGSRPLKSQAYLELSTLADNPAMMINYHELLLRVLQNSSTTWEAKDFLDQCQQNTFGFGYKIRWNERKVPTGVLTMFAQQREDLVRYCDVMSMDMQGRQFNEWGWPMCSPMGFSCERKNCSFCDSMLPGERIQASIWVFKTMEELEPRFKLTMIRIIYVDEFCIPGQLSSVPWNTRNLSPPGRLLALDRHMWCVGETVWTGGVSSNSEPLEAYVLM
jgi:hypothetical protein